ncbi:tagaturonate reductase [Vallitalea pronyensis]|uniref:Tagaturonate reductase n=1 Tax=Vallitalea pronyensis TaxID=1348613 RepID=A0A8J8MKK3_9FIRM|nr:tagaturonate reductase [Vallitalea pronyensis]QUI23370.1 tagaturonate reductase [Vallitalea pronyensis]
MRLSSKHINRIKRPERILQFGEGNFLRAFTDWMIHKINQEALFNGHIVVVQPIEKGLIDILNEQDGLYTLYLKGIQNGQCIQEHLCIDAISRAINPYGDYDAFLKTATLEEMRFVISNTTEAGIYYEEADQLTDTPQKSYPGKLTAWLYHRYQYFQGDCSKGMVIIPCELIDKNAEKLKKIIMKLAAQWQLEYGFMDWLEKANTFCNSLVDRIVPGYPRERIDEINIKLGYEDKLVVEGEPFHLWVIEAPEELERELPLNRTDLQVLFVKDLTPYRTRKVRILNGAHTSMVPIGYLYGLRTVRACVEDQVIGQYVRNTIFEEIIPTLTLPYEALEAFANDVMERFKNPYIQHYLMGISLNAMSKYKTRVLPSLITYYQQKHELPKRLVMALAAYICFYKGKYANETIELQDEQWVLDFYSEQWKKEPTTIEDYKNMVVQILNNEKLWGRKLSEIDGLEDLLAHYVQIIYEKGIHEIVDNL